MFVFAYLSGIKKNKNLLFASKNYFLLRMKLILLCLIVWPFLLQVESITGNRASGRCKTICTSAGCRCQSSGVPLHQVDHVYFTDSKKDRIISCLCGDVRVSTFFYLYCGKYFSKTYTFMPTLRI